MAPPLADLAASSVLVSASSLNWGGTFSASTDVQNLDKPTPARSWSDFCSPVKAARSRTRFTWRRDGEQPGRRHRPGGQPSRSRFPVACPNGVTLSSVGYARIAVIVDPENVVSESLYTDNQASRPRSSCGCREMEPPVPTTAAAGALPSLASLAAHTQAKAKQQARAAIVARNQAKASKKKLKRKVGSAGSGLVTKAESLGKELTKLPTQVFDALKRGLSELPPGTTSRRRAPGTAALAGLAGGWSLP